MKNKTYQGASLSKKQAEWVRWYEIGSNNWWEAFYQYEGRRPAIRGDETSKAWFNSVLKRLKQKGLFLNVPFAFLSDAGIYWMHPGFQNDGYVVEIGVENDPNLLTLQKPIL